MSRQSLSVVSLVIVMAIIAFTLSACSQKAPEPPTGNVAGDATQIETAFDDQFPQEEATTFSDDFDTLDKDLAFS